MDDAIIPVRPGVVDDARPTPARVRQAPSRFVNFRDSLILVLGLAVAGMLAIPMMTGDLAEAAIRRIQLRTTADRVRR